MADYIRREDALFALRKAERGGSMTALTRLERAYAEIREMPAADVAEVVRCKDCKMWGNQNIFGHSDTGRMRRGGYCMCSRFTRYEDDFCSSGEYQTNTGGNDNVSD